MTKGKRDEFVLFSFLISSAFGMVETLPKITAKCTLHLLALFVE